MLETLSCRRHRILKRQQVVAGVNAEPGVGITHRRRGDTARGITGSKSSLQIVMQPGREFLNRHHVHSAVPRTPTGTLQVGIKPTNQVMQPGKASTRSARA
jgi:hypothetical protein